MIQQYCELVFKDYEGLVDPPIHSNLMIAFFGACVTAVKQLVEQLERNMGEIRGEIRGERLEVRD